MDIAGTVIGVVGLTGQILQGCNYICDFFHHAKDAPESIRDLHTSVRNLNDVVAVVETIAKNSDQQSSSMLASSCQIATLNECKNVIQELEAFLKEYTSKISQAKSSVLMVQMNMLHVDQLLKHSTAFAQGQETLQRLEDLPLMLRTIVQDEVKAVLLVHQPQTSAQDTMSTTSSLPESQTHYSGHYGLLDLGQTQSGTRNTQCGLSGKRQTHQFRRRDTWFGRIEIRWTTTTQDYRSGQVTEYLTASSREIKMYVNTWLAKSVISFISGDTQPKLPDLSFNNRLRFSRVHIGPRVRDDFHWKLVGDNSMESAVSRAIRCADVDTVQRLLRTRETHPRDCILVHTEIHRTGLSYYSLLDFTTMMMTAYRNFDYGKANRDYIDFRLRLYTIAQQLIVFGADCSRFWSDCATDLWLVHHDSAMLASLVKPMTDVVRISFQLRADFEYCHGKGYLEYVLNGGRLGREWEVHQGSEWCKMAVILRYSRQEVERRFGYWFWTRYVEDSKNRRAETCSLARFDAELACGEFFSGVERQTGSGRRILSSQEAAHNDCAREGQNEIACADDADASYNGGCDDESDREGYVTADE
ncbi:hypothetical protein LTS15_010695 [Exophiala xenobiotica]|nr:hypothetical protein LTS15_010695 [Exophiala xenobiotica]